MTFLIILFWLVLIAWGANGFWTYMPPKLSHFALLVLLIILGLKTFGNPFSA
jgi:hypothetical protein